MDKPTFSGSPRRSSALAHDPDRDGDRRPSRRTRRSRPNTSPSSRPSCRGRDLPRRRATSRTSSRARESPFKDRGRRLVDRAPRRSADRRLVAPLRQRLGQRPRRERGRPTARASICFLDEARRKRQGHVPLPYRIPVGGGEARNAVFAHATRRSRPTVGQHDGPQAHRIPRGRPRLRSASRSSRKKARRLPDHLRRGLPLPAPVGGTISRPARSRVRSSLDGARATDIVVEPDRRPTSRSRFLRRRSSTTVYMFRNASTIVNSEQRRRRSSRSIENPGKLGGDRLEPRTASSSRSCPARRSTIRWRAAA